MAMFKDFLGGESNLDDLETYSHYKWANFSTMQLHDECMKEIGYALFYTQYLYPSPHYGSQLKRINGFCNWYAREGRRHFTDTPENRLWYKKFLYRFLDEIENLC